MKEQAVVESSELPVRYAVVGLGYIAQAAVLPAFKHARENSELTALVSDDPAKLRRLARKYGVRHVYSYDDYEECLRAGHVDAVYIALPNSMHCRFAVQAAEAGIHVLCEKPMAISSDECTQMIDAAGAANVRLMIAYRLHFEAANLAAVQAAQSGKIGDLRLFNSVFSMSVKQGNIRLDRELGGGTLWDIGIYCINAARYLFRSEPYEVAAFSERGPDPRFREVDEMTAALMRFPQNRLATFVSSFGASDVSTFRLVGAKGDVRLDPAYEFAESLRAEITIRGKTDRAKYRRRDQFAPLLIYFADCVRTRAAPEPSGEEGLADVRIIEALYESARVGHPIRLEPFRRSRRPEPTQATRKPSVRKPRLVHAEAPSL